MDTVTTRIEVRDLKILSAIAKQNNHNNTQMVGVMIRWWIKTHCPECGEKTTRAVRCRCKDRDLQ